MYYCIECQDLIEADKVMPFGDSLGHSTYDMGSTYVCGPVKWVDFKRCDECHGAGLINVSHIGNAERWGEVKCYKCKGNGFIIDTREVKA